MKKNQTVYFVFGDEVKKGKIKEKKSTGCYEVESCDKIYNTCNPFKTRAEAEQELLWDKIKEVRSSF